MEMKRERNKDGGPHVTLETEGLSNRETTLCLVDLKALALKQVIHKSLNKLMFSVSHRRYMKVLEEVGPLLLAINGVERKLEKVLSGLS